MAESQRTRRRLIANDPPPLPHWGSPSGGRDEYLTQEAAARAALEAAMDTFNPWSTGYGREAAGWIYRLPNGHYGFTDPIYGLVDKVYGAALYGGLADFAAKHPDRVGEIVGWYHNHGSEFDPGYERFSGADGDLGVTRGAAERFANPGMLGYLMTPSLAIKSIGINGVTQTVRGPLARDEWPSDSPEAQQHRIEARRRGVQPNGSASPGSVTGTSGTRPSTPGASRGDGSRSRDYAPPERPSGSGGGIRTGNGSDDRNGATGGRRAPETGAFAGIGHVVNPDGTVYDWNAEGLTITWVDGDGQTRSQFIPRAEIGEFERQQREKSEKEAKEKDAEALADDENPPEKEDEAEEEEDDFDPGGNTTRVNPDSDYEGNEGLPEDVFIVSNAGSRFSAGLAAIQSLLAPTRPGPHPGDPPPPGVGGGAWDAFAPTGTTAMSAPPSGARDRVMTPEEVALRARSAIRSHYSGGPSDGTGQVPVTYVGEEGPTSSGLALSASGLKKMIWDMHVAPRIRIEERANRAAMVSRPFRANVAARARHGTY